VVNHKNVINFETGR